MRLSGQFHSVYFLGKDVKGTKTQIEPKPTNKTKTSKQKLLSSCFYLFISAHKSLWPNRQGRLLSLHETFKNAGSKTVRGRLHGCGILTSKEALGT